MLFTRLLFSRQGANWLPSLAAVVLLAVAQPVLAQTATPTGTLAYNGPRYPGGPDSLRAFVARQLRGTNPAWVGDVFVRLTIDPAGSVTKAEYLNPAPGMPASTLVRNADVRALVTQVVQRMPRWQPALAEPGPEPTGRTPLPPAEVRLRLPFGNASPAPLPYADTNPVFNVPTTLRTRPPYPITIQEVLQRAFRYPPADLRAGRQGEAYAYYEVSETGVVENARVVGSLSPTIDAEVLRVLGQLPTASQPPRQAGRPVRAYCVVMVRLVIQ